MVFERTNLQLPVSSLLAMLVALSYLGVFYALYYEDRC